MTRASVSLVIVALYCVTAASTVSTKNQRHVAISTAPTRMGAEVWGQAIDSKTGRTYYWNKQTLQTTWLRPAELDAAPVPVEPPKVPSSNESTETPAAALPTKSKVLRAAAQHDSNASPKATSRPRTRRNIASLAQDGLARYLQATDIRPAVALARGACLSSVLAAAAVFL